MHARACGMRTRKRISRRCRSLTPASTRSRPTTSTARCSRRGWSTAAAWGISASPISCWPNSSAPRCAMACRYWWPAANMHATCSRRLLWNKYEEWQWKEKDTALGRAFAHYDFERDIERGLDRMAEAESEAMILHEIGEARAEKLLGDDWNAMLGQLSSRHAELLARAVRDHLADCLVTLPTLLEREAIGALHFYLANLSGLRRALFPALPQAYEAWLGSGDPAKLASVVKTAEAHWLDAARHLSATCRHDPARCDAQINALAGGDLAGLRL